MGVGGPLVGLEYNPKPSRQPDKCAPARMALDEPGPANAALTNVSNSIGAKPGWNAQRSFALRRLGKLHSATPGTSPKAKAVVLDQVRPASPARRAGADNPARRRQQAGCRRACGQLGPESSSGPIAKGNIDTFLCETYRSVHPASRSTRDPSLLHQKAGQHWRQPQPTEQRRSAHMQPAGRDSVCIVRPRSISATSSKICSRHS